MQKVHVQGYNGVEFENLFIEKNGKKLAVLFPGIGYNNDMPLQYYTAKLLEQQGYDILKVNYRYNDKPEFLDATFEEKMKWMHEDVKASLDEILKEKSYEDILLVCKSIGTIAGLEALKIYQSLNQAKIIWLTPLTHNSIMVEQLKTLQNDGLIIIGTDDPCYVKENIDELSKMENYEVCVFPQADHSMELVGNPLASIDIIKQVLLKIESFLTEK